MLNNFHLKILVQMNNFIMQGHFLLKELYYLKLCPIFDGPPLRNLQNTKIYFDHIYFKQCRGKIYRFFQYHRHTSQDSFYKWTKISSLEIDIFGLKMMLKSGLEFFILKFTEPLQRYLLTCQANSTFLGRFFCTGQQQL